MPFCCFEAFLEKFTPNFLFLDIKVTISEMSTGIFRKIVFLTLFERGKPEENLDMFIQLFLNKAVKGDKY